MHKWAATQEIVLKETPKKEAGLMIVKRYLLREDSIANILVIIIRQIFKSNTKNRKQPFCTPISVHFQIKGHMVQREHYPVSSTKTIVIVNSTKHCHKTC